LKTPSEIISLSSENCIFQYNTAINLIYGIFLDYKSRNNIVRYNKVTKSIGEIIVMTVSSGNEVFDNIWGIGIYNKSHNNLVYRNIIRENDIDLMMMLEPNNNFIENDTFMKNLFCVESVGITRNYWNNNYLNRPRLFPKLIFAYIRGSNGGPTLIPIPYCITGLDRNPLRERPI
jgi:hypothetical protein